MRIAVTGASGGGTQRLPRAVPFAKAAEMIFFGQRIDAQEAYRIGLVNKVVPQEQLMPTVEEWAQKLCEMPPLAVRAAKEAMIRGTGMNLDDGLMLESRLMDVVVASEDHKEARDAWLEKRKPTLKGK